MTNSKEKPSKPEKPTLPKDGKYPSEYVKGYFHGEYDIHEEWEEWIDNADIESCLPPQSSTPFDMGAYADDIRKLLKGE